MPSEVFLEDLKEAFIKFHVYLAERQGKSTNTRDFEHALRELDGNFISTDQKAGWKISYIAVRFHNPSIKDFLVNWLIQNPSLVFEICEAVVFFRQLQILWRLNSYTFNRDGRNSPIQTILYGQADKLIRHFERMLNSFDYAISTLEKASRISAKVNSPWWVGYHMC